MDYENTIQHDEINLVRLVRRIEKSAAKEDDWKPRAAEPKEQICLRAQKSLQNVKYARRLLKNIEADEFEAPSTRITYLNGIKIKLDRAEAFLKEVELSSKPESRRPSPILPTLPIPEPPRLPSSTLEVSPQASHEHSIGTLASSEPIEKSLSPRISTQGLFISPPDLEEFSPTLITSTLPSLLPSNPAETATASGFARNFGAVPTARGQTSTAIQEELTSQLELMAKQLKRNAMHFSNSLEKDKAVVEDAQGKLEVNHDVMQKERLRLRDHSGKSRGTTCMVLGIILLVLVVFMLMVSFIRFS
ncbi:hypothetical protein HYPSUDRAFT_49770 [Hypholoma sublateritium FD-334 SS-4]|uniref:Uncharacterized protein n=1 Tax=Hypholoma sublateritium (strain FD-334 SS-4) TaxID=945553 RepID=A0A0D2KGF1_HYPSF|nr:hypothetical protein HYPSUDRAFT_49770 [Hypholoma sublateritium FD-334 SS-4]